MNEWINTIIISIALLIIAHYIYETFFNANNNKTSHCGNDDGDRSKEEDIEKYKSMMDDLAKALQEKETQLITQQNTQANATNQMHATATATNQIHATTTIKPQPPQLTDMEQQWMSTQLNAFLGKLHASLEQ